MLAVARADSRDCVGRLGRGEGGGWILRVVADRPLGGLGGVDVSVACVEEVHPHDYSHFVSAIASTQPIPGSTYVPQVQLLS